MKKMVCSLLAFLLLTGCAPAVDPDLTPESIMENALRKTPEEVEENLGLVLDDEHLAEHSSTAYAYDCAVSFAGQTANEVDFTLYEAELDGETAERVGAVAYAFDQWDSPEDAWDFLCEMTEKAKEEGLRPALNDVYGQGDVSSFEQYGSYQEFDEAMKAEYAGYGVEYPVYRGEARFYLDERTHLVFTMQFGTFYPFRAAVSYEAVILRGMNEERSFK